jgi:hypothetical protein
VPKAGASSSRRGPVAGIQLSLALTAADAPSIERIGDATGAGVIRRRVFIIYGGAIVAGIGLGLLSLAGALLMFPAWGVVHNGAWTIDPVMGSPAAGPYSRAWMSLFGALAVVPEGAAYYLGYEDSAGSPLTARCTYTVTGRDLDAGWWSITVYGANGFLLRDAGGRFSMTRDSVPRAPDGSFRFTLAGTGTAAAAAADAIPTGGGSFNLELRVYAPAAGVLANLGEAPVPEIERRECH